MCERGDVSRLLLAAFRVAKAGHERVGVGPGTVDPDHLCGHGVHVALGRQERVGRLRRKLSDEATHLGVEVFGRDNPVEKAGPKCLVGAERTARHHQFLGECRPDFADEAGNATPGEWDTEVDFGDGERRVGGSHPKVARRGEHETSTNAPALDAGNRDGAHRFDGVGHPPPGVGVVAWVSLADERAAGRPEGGGICAGAEDPPVPLDGHDLHGGLGIEPAGGDDDLLHGSGRERVQLLGSIERKDSQLAVNPNLEVGERRGGGVRHHPHRSWLDQLIATVGEMDVAVVDYQATDAHAQFARSLKETGFAVVVNHPIAPALIEQVQNEWLDYFTSSYDKRAYIHSGEGDGYYPPDVSETAKGASIKDLKEFFHIYPEWGQYPAEVGRSALDLYAQATAVAKTLLGWVERNTPPDIAKLYSMPLSQMVHGSRRTLLRILRYPPLRGDEPVGAVRAAAHEDINLITVLPAANEPGLQVKDSSGTWHDVPCDLGSLAINAGDMLQYASGGYFPSTTHRVVNPTGESAGRSRVSMPLFLHPQDDVVLADARTAASFLAERIAVLRGERPASVS